MGWSYDFWRGNFYPQDMKAAEYLHEYSKHFDTVEVNNTFYRIPSENTVMKWGQQTPRGFLFALKFPRVITHVKMLRNCENEVNRFLEYASKLEDKLGPLLLQFPPTFRNQHLHLLKDFLPSLPKKYRFAVEARNRELQQEKFYSLLRENRIALVMLDRASMPEIDEITADFAYARWERDRKQVKGVLGKVEVDRSNDIKRWAEKIRGFPEATPVFGYFSKYYSGHPPTDAKQLRRFLELER